MAIGKAIRMYEFSDTTIVAETLTNGWIRGQTAALIISLRVHASTRYCPNLIRKTCGTGSLKPCRYFVHMFIHSIFTPASVRINLLESCSWGYPLYNGNQDGS